MSSRSLVRGAGFTLVEMVIAIVIISVGLTGVLLAFNTAVKSSVDPLVHKQMLAIAEEMMEEILLKPYTESGTKPSNARRSCGAATSRTGFDDIRDYDGYQTTGICDVDGMAVVGLETYDVGVEAQRVSADWQGIADTLHVTVTVEHGNEQFVLQGWRTDYAS